jgi:DNA-binding transcriptional ArsR family regulator
MTIPGRRTRQEPPDSSPAAESTQAATRFFRALADRTRLRLVNLLTRGTLCVCDLQRILGEPQSTVSRHLAYLKAAGLVSDRRDGVRIFYRLAADQDALRRAVFDAIRGHTGRGPRTQGQGQPDDFKSDLQRLGAMQAVGACHEEPPDRRPVAVQIRRAAETGGAAPRRA